MKIELRLRAGVIAALDERGNPVLATIAPVRNYGRGNQVYLPKGWEGKRVAIVEVSGTP